jgi:hypothetical protein
MSHSPGLIDIWEIADATDYDERKRIMLEENDVKRRLVGKYVETYAYADGRLDVRWKGHSLPYTIFDKDQRVTHAAVAAEPKTNSDKNGYKPRGRKPGRRIS